MEKFGFSLSKARVINYDANDRGIVRYIIEREPSLKPVSYTHLDVYKRQEYMDRIYERGASETGILKN